MNRKKFIFLPFVGLAFLALATWAVMLLWNHVLVDVVPAVKIINYWQAGGLLLLSKILFSGFGGRGGWKKGNQQGMGGHWRQKWGKMTPEEREKMKEEWKKRCEK